MKIEEPMWGLKVIIPDLEFDKRGFFAELYRKDLLGVDFVQQNISQSHKDVIRGLHFQYDPPMGKLIRVLNGYLFVVAVDIRKNSPTLGQYYSGYINAGNKIGLYVPSGFALGYCAFAEATEVEYLNTAHWNAKGEGIIKWDDPTIGVKWPITAPILSEKDRTAQTLKEWLKTPESDLCR